MAAVCAGAVAGLMITPLNSPATASTQYGGGFTEISIVSASVTQKGAVALRVEMVGWMMYPTLIGQPLNKIDGGHWVIFVDGKCKSVSASATGMTKPLRKGSHGVYAELANNDGSYLSPEVRSSRVLIKVVTTAWKKGKFRASRWCVQKPVRNQAP
jgi:hypothetical protein